jgi:hypothetical protein
MKACFDRRAGSPGQPARLPWNTWGDEHLKPDLEVRHYPVVTDMRIPDATRETTR